MFRKSFSRLELALAQNRFYVAGIAEKNLVLSSICKGRSLSSSQNDDDDDLTRPISSGGKPTKRPNIRSLTQPASISASASLSSSLGPSSRLAAPTPLGLDEIIDGPSGATSTTRDTIDESANAIVIATAQAQSQFEHVRRLLSQQADRLRRFDEFALASAKREAVAAARAAEGLPFESESSTASATSGGDTRGMSAPAQGLAVDYCIFCYHGTRGLLKHDNTALLSRFVSERGALLPKRFTKACAKHQRRLAQTVKRSRWLNLLPFHGKLHPRLRFSGLRVPEPTRTVTHGSGITAGEAQV